MLGIVAAFPSITLKQLEYGPVVVNISYSKLSCACDILSPAVSVVHPILYL